MDSNRKARDALKLICQEFGVPERLTFDSYKEHAYKGTKLMKEVHRKGIDYQMSETDVQNQNCTEGVIREVRRKWYRTMVNKRVPRKLWDYGVSWVSESMLMTHSPANSVNGDIPLKNVTNKTFNISKYLDFSFYDKFWF